MLTEPQILFALGAELVSLHKTEEFKVGNHAFSGAVELKISGAVTRERDQMVKPDPKISLAVLLALLSRRLKIKIGDLYKILLEAAAAAYKGEKPIAEFLDLSTQAIRDGKELVAKRLKRVPKNGALKRSMTIEVTGISGAGLKLLKRRA